MLKVTKDTGGSGIDAFLGRNTSFNGTLVFDGEVRIDGNFEGNVKTNDTLVIAEQGNVKADIEAGTVKISGKFDGVIVAKNKVELFKPAFVTGTLRTPVIKMEEGVVLNGAIEMNQGRNGLAEKDGK
ncbi:MAG: polymer-forming cytoskeletal protein [Deferribacterales bacterium]|nr:polymer-forming cytoskeletal protein [Deferribacterales bacterium]